MATLEPLPYAWRLSRYEEALRGRGAEYESWTDISDVGKSFNGITLTEAEYLRIEDLYVDAVMRLSAAASTDLFEIVWLGQQEEGFALAKGQRLVRSDLAPVVRGNLRGVLDCGLQGVGGRCQLEFGFDLYMRFAADSPCDRAIADIESAGLYVEAGESLILWEN